MVIKKLELIVTVVKAAVLSPFAEMAPESHALLASAMVPWLVKGRYHKDARVKAILPTGQLNICFAPS